MLQAAVRDGVALDAFAFCEDHPSPAGRAAKEIARSEPGRKRQGDLSITHIWLGFERGAAGEILNRQNLL